MDFEVLYLFMVVAEHMINRVLECEKQHHILTTIFKTQSEALLIYVHSFAIR